jgi:multidrug efflux pump subunit AcrA (membrane-fusion protein)
MLKMLLSGRKKFIFLGIFILLVAFIGWQIFFRQSSAPQYQTTPVESGTIVSSVSASGQVLVSNIHTITTQASGTVSQVLVHDSDQVSKGQTLITITLDNQGLQGQSQAYASYLSAQSSLESAKASQYSLNSAMWTANQKFINDAVARDLDETDPTYIEEHSDWLAAEAKYQNQQQAITQAQASLNNAWLSYQQTRGTITAPDSGTITGLSVAVGMSIGSTDSNTGSQTSQRVAALVTPGNPLVTLNVNEVDIPSVNAGQSVTLTLDSLPDTTFTGQVASVDKIGSVSSGVTSYPVIIQLDTNAPQILPNMSISANIIVATKNDVLLVPSGAIQQQNDQSVVQILVDGQVRSITVQTGLTSDTQTEIVSGLSQGDQVITGTSLSTSSQTDQSPFSRSGFGSSGVRVFSR